MNFEQLRAEIARRRPWYQRIEFPEFGVTTTDDPANAMIDSAWDNVIGGIYPGASGNSSPHPEMARDRAAPADNGGARCT